MKLQSQWWGRVLILAVASLLVATSGKAQVRDEDWQEVPGTRHQTPVRGNGPERRYSNVGGNPRHAPIGSMADAVRYMATQPGFANDLKRLGSGLQPRFRHIFGAQIVPYVWEVVRKAHTHHYMRQENCPLCGVECEPRRELVDLLKDVEIEQGTVYAMLTFGRAGGAVANMRYCATQPHRAYRIIVDDVVIEQVIISETRKQVWTGNFSVDLLATCGNLGVTGELVATEFMIPVKPTVVEQELTQEEVTAVAKAKAEARAKASSHSTSNATAYGGSVVINNFPNFPAPREWRYERPNESKVSRDTVVLGGITWVPMAPRVSAKATQQQFQGQWQSQLQNQTQSSVNNNVNNNLNLNQNNIGVGVAAN